MQCAVLSLVAANAAAFTMTAPMHAPIRTSTPTMGGGKGPDPQQKNVKIPTKTEWVTFANVADCKPNTIIAGFRKGQEIAIATTKSGKLYALSNKLPPVGQPATSANIFEGDVIVEPITATAFSLKTGKVQGTWCPSPIGKLVFSWLIGQTDAQVFPVRKQGKGVQVLIDVNLKAKFEQQYWRGVLDAQGKVDGGYY